MQETFNLVYTENKKTTIIENRKDYALLVHLKKQKKHEIQYNKGVFSIIPNKDVENYIKKWIIPPGGTFSKKKIGDPEKIKLYKSLIDKGFGRSFGFELEFSSCMQYIVKKYYYKPVYYDE